MSEGYIPVLFDKCQERRLILAALNGCISSLTAITLACQRDVRNVSGETGT
jgi:hypothetical protein